jgi:hypothetical protein
MQSHTVPAGELKVLLREIESAFYPKVSTMNLVITAALIVGFVVCLAIGFLSLARDLLTRLVEESASRSLEARPEQSDHEYEHPLPSISVSHRTLSV